MFELFKRGTKITKLNKNVLRRNDISLLILDERWNNLFVYAQKSPEIEKCEEALRELVKEQARLIAESKELALRKKSCMGRIVELTPNAFDDNSQKARDDMKECEKEIIRINNRLPQIEKQLDEIPDKIKQKNLELLEYTVNQVYFKVRSGRKRVQQLDLLIEETKEKLKAYIDERETLSEGTTDVYSYFHDLLGADELERLDSSFLDK